MDLSYLPVPALALAATLPAISALLLIDTRRPYVSRYALCVLSYVLVCCLIQLGYAFESALSILTQVPHYYSVTAREWWLLLARTEFDLPNLSITISVSCIVCFVLLLGRDQRARSANTLRSAFVSFVIFDIFVGIETGYTFAHYIYDVVFDFVGAVVLSTFAPFFVNRIIPATAKKDAPA
jgi:hypothetical protein